MVIQHQQVVTQIGPNILGSKYNYYSQKEFGHMILQQVVTFDPALNFNGVATLPYTLCAEIPVSILLTVLSQ
jgi:hypothetical protein